MTSDMILSACTLKAVSCSSTLSTFIFFIIFRCTEIRNNPCCPPTSSSSRWFRLNSFSFNCCFPMNFLLNIDGVKTKDAFSLLLFLLFRISFFFWVGFDVILNNACKGSISNCSCYLFSTLNACVFFAVYQVSKTSPTKSMITRLHCHRNAHYIVAERTSNLFLY